MRVLVLTQWYTPEPVEIILGLVTSLRQAGHQVQVLTGFPNYPTGRLYPGYSLRLLRREVTEGIPITRVALYPDHGRSPVRRALNYLSFAASASALGPLAVSPADLMWVYHPPLTVGIPASWIGFLRRIPFVYTIQDMWPESLAATGMTSNGLVPAALGRLARFVYKHAAALTVISPGFRSNLLAKGVPESKIHLIPNWADGAVYRPVPRDRELAARHGLAGRFNVVFAGNMGAAQGLKSVLQAATALQSHPEIQFVLIGDGLELPALKQEACALGLGNVRFVDRQPPQQVPHLLAWADALLVPLRDDPLFRITIPSKTLAYLACGRPVIAAVAGDGADVIGQARAGMVCAPDDPAALAETVLAMYRLPPAQREALGQAGRQAFLEHYTKEAITGQYMRLFEEVAGSKRPRAGAFGPHSVVEPT